MIAYFHKNRCGALLGALCLIILLNPILADTSWGGFVLTVLLLAVLVLASWALRVRGPVLALLIGLSAVVIAVLVVRPSHQHFLWPAGLAALAAFTAVITICLLHYVLNPQPITSDKVFGAVDAYVLVAFTFASLYVFLELVQPNPFHVSLPGHDGELSWAELMYFSFTVMTSTGFGEITPATNMARSLIVIEQVLGVMYVAFLIARLANLYGRER